MSNLHDLIPTSLPLSPQNIHPDELKVILAEAEARHAEAVAALEAAQDHFDAAERQRAYALTEEQKRLEREDRFRIDKLRGMVPVLDDDAARFARRFRAEFDQEQIDFTNVLFLFTAWSRYRTLAHAARTAVIRYDSQQDTDDYNAWMRRIAGWGQLIRAVTSHRNGGALLGDADDAEGLAEVNARIEEESKEAPRPVTRDADDTLPPMIEDLGIRNPALAGFYHQPLIALELNLEISKAMQEASEAWASRAISHIADRARAEFAEQAASSLNTEDEKPKGKGR